MVVSFVRSSKGESVVVPSFPTAGRPGSAVEVDRRSGDEARCVARKERDRSTVVRVPGFGPGRLRDPRDPRIRVLTHRVDPAGRNHVRGDAVDPDPPRCQFEGEALGQARDCGLHGGVDGESRPGAVGLDARHVHDRSPRAHVRHGRTNARGHGPEILAHEGVLPLRAHVEERRPGATARVVHEHVDRAERALRPLDPRPDGPSSCTSIVAEWVARPSASIDFAHAIRPASSRSQIETRRHSARARGGGAPEPRGCARNEGDASFQGEGGRTEGAVGPDRRVERHRPSVRQGSPTGYARPPRITPVRRGTQ